MGQTSGQLPIPEPVLEQLAASVVEAEVAKQRSQMAFDLICQIYNVPRETTAMRLVARLVPRSEVGLQA